MVHLRTGILCPCGGEGRDEIQRNFIAAGALASLLESAHLLGQRPQCPVQCDAAVDAGDFAGAHATALHGAAGHAAACQRLLDALEAETGREFLLTIAPGAGIDKYSLINWNQVHPHLDWINLMTYDMHGAFDPSTNFNAPLYASPNDPGSYPSNVYSIDNAVTGYLAAGVPPSKLTVGLPFYGRGWQGVPNGGTNGLYQPASGGAPGTYESGIEDYKVLKNLTYPVYRDPITQVPWMYNGNIFWSFDDAQSLTNKVNYIHTKGLRGAMVWSLDGDDTSGTLMNAVGGALNSQ